jgi:hypothetical protein
MVEWTGKKKGISTAMMGSERVEFGEWCACEEFGGIHDEWKRIGRLSQLCFEQIGTRAHTRVNVLLQMQKREENAVQEWYLPNHLPRYLHPIIKTDIRIRLKFRHASPVIIIHNNNTFV